MQRIRICKLTDVIQGRGVEKRIFARRFAVFRLGNVLYGTESECRHMRASLAKGEVRDGVVTCPWHGWKYDLNTGRCLTQEGFGRRRYRVEVEGDEVFIILP
jgi:nitrite reductase/ring-hydroxylating ferredoxin subunit